MRLKILTLSAMALLASGCSKTCMEQVAISQLTVTETAKTITAMNDAEMVSLGDMETAAEITTKAGEYVESARLMCVVDEDGAFDYLDAVDILMGDVTEVLKGDE